MNVTSFFIYLSSALCLRSGSEAAVFSARGGAVLSVLSVQHGAASIQAVEMTEDYLLLFCRYTNTRNKLQGEHRSIPVSLVTSSTCL